jgi:preprotein translocase subunit SecE
MRKPYLIILVISMLLTASLWWIDDDPPYANVWDTVREIIIIGSIFTIIFWCIISGIYWLINRIPNKK